MPLGLNQFWLLTLYEFSFMSMFDIDYWLLLLRHASSLWHSRRLFVDNLNADLASRSFFLQQTYNQSATICSLLV